MHVYPYLIFLRPFQAIPLFPSDSPRKIAHFGGINASVALTATPFMPKTEILTNFAVRNVENGRIFVYILYIGRFEPEPPNL